MSQKKEHESAAAAIRKLQVKGAADVRITSLSGGNQQKCLIARALPHTTPHPAPR
ncbi:MAG UNVERIFIED_CONTAM: hypothetical protein LVR18_01310 [Planctomycetaceae bacterium]